MNVTRIRRPDSALHVILWRDMPYASPGLTVSVSKGGGIGADLTIGGMDYDGSIRLNLGLASVHLSAARVISHALRYRSRTWAERRAAWLNARFPEETGPVYPYELDPLHGRTTVFYLTSRGVIAMLWQNSAGWNSTDRMKAPWNGNDWSTEVPLVDWAIGAPVVVEEVTSSCAAAVVMPEGPYAVTVTLSRVRTDRRLWRGRWWSVARIDVADDGVPIPGKDWLGDAVYSSSFAVRPEDDALAAVNAFTSGILRERDGWLPEAVRAC